ncbi:2'-5' RNA ligase family protein [Amnibacterium sp. CER49]|uniref:2'-5' RNA ligase family protein n=1 Tax=Amnibacterium sp. CER49 TaxID=3039161 RepID=UPI002448DA9A|nr:2'-5' RNA ligase family protein [Amnibacterium sp. CER49]MDH2445354.1 2'-5' RNA ligase family protein [Amnibacterium sp. CER49]
MVQSVELLLDPAAEDRVRADWDALAAVDLPSLASNAHESNRPHVTVAVAETGLTPALDGLQAVFRGWELATEGLAGIVGGPVLFGGQRGRWVLARQIVPSRPLLTMHSAVHRMIALEAPGAEVVDQTVPDGWTAHVTIARRIPAGRLAEALGLLDPDPLPCRFVAARLWDGGARTVTPLA